MRLTITGANSLLARTLISALPAATLVRAVDNRFDTAPPGADLLVGDLRDAAFAAQVAANSDALLHLAPLYSRLDDELSSLDQATRGTYELVNAAAAAGVGRIILGSSLDLFAPVWTKYRVDESWRPQPPAELDPLCAYLAEVTTREVVRVTGTPALCLRLGEVVDDATAAAQPYDPRWLHADDAVAALLRALTVETSGWQIYHITAAGPRAWVPVARAADEAFGYAPQVDFQSRWPTQLPSSPPAAPPIAARPIRQVVVFGAGGPLGAAVAAALSNRYTLRLTDVKPIDQLAAGPPQSPGAPQPVPPQPPHEWQVVDIRDGQQVLAACAGMDAIVNCTVLRNDPVDAFRVNTLGAYNVMQAALAHGIQRVVHTGPYMMGQRDAGGYNWDDYIVDDVPPRPGTWWVYFPSKLLGQEICRLFALHHGLQVPTLTFAQFLNPDEPNTRSLSALAVAWQDAAEAIRCALEVERLPSPYEYFHIGADLPHGVYPNEKAKRLLGWQPVHRFEEFYRRGNST